MSISVRRRAAMVTLALSLLGGGALLAANNAMLAPTADGGEPGTVIVNPGPPLSPGMPTTVDTKK